MMRLKVHRRDAAHQVRETQEPQTSLADYRPRLGHLGRHRLAHRPRPQLLGASHLDRLRVLQRRLCYLLFAFLLLHPVHHHGLPLLSNIQGKYQFHSRSFMGGSLANLFPSSHKYPRH